MTIGATKVGFGYDIHRLVEGRPLWLGCVQIDHDRGLDGFSDADVVAHAIADAALGCAGLGDIGQNFPGSDERWRDVSGADLLTETRSRVTGRGFTIVQIDVTLLAEGPRLAPHLDSMAERLAAVTECKRSAIAVKARTNEGLDAIGRGEAIAVHALVVLRRTAAG